MENLQRWCARHPNWMLALLTLAALLPFLAKPFNMDDPLFIWAGKQIQAHPADPFGFTVNWGLTALPMWKETDNPPLACYYVALAGGIFGWSEIALHFAFLFPALAVILGTHRLAKNFCNSPALAALATLLTPVFLVSANTVMCDVLMLAFWIWAMVFWIEGLERDDFRKLFLAGIFIALATLTKYFGFALIPLLGVHGALAKRRGVWPAFLLIPLAAFAIYQWLMSALYGAVLSQAASFAATFKAETRVESLLTGLAFTGGCVATGFFFAPLLWRKKSLAILAASVVVIAPLVLLEKNLSRWIEGTPAPAVQIQIIFWAVAGVFVLALAFADIFERRDARAWLLFLWVLGTFFFAAFLNWTVNGRSILPIAPAAGILIARRLEKNILAGWKILPFIPISIAASAVLALLVARADFLYAVAVRDEARQVAAKFAGEKDHLYFQGHWGFHFYMQAAGMNQFDVYHTALKPGDLLVNPDYNTLVLPPSPDAVAKTETVSVAGPRFLATMNPPSGAGFYASLYGPLPFAFGDIAPEKVYIYFLKTNAPAK